MLQDPSHFNKSKWYTPDVDLLIEYLKVLIGIKKNIPNINARIHEVCTKIAMNYLLASLSKHDKVCNKEMHPDPSQGPDIKFEVKKPKEKICKFQAEIATNFSFKQQPQAEKLYADVKKLINSKADKKYLVVLSKELEDSAIKRLKRSQKNPIDLEEKNVLVISIERIIGENL